MRAMAGQKTDRTPVTGIAQVRTRRRWIPFTHHVHHTPPSMKTPSESRRQTNENGKGKHKLLARFEQRT